MQFNWKKDDHWPEDNSSPTYWGQERYGRFYKLIAGLLVVISGCVAFFSKSYVAFAILNLIATAIYWYGRRRSAYEVTQDNQGVQFVDIRPRVLYLRSFGTDASWPNWISEEEQLASSVESFGVMVAVGCPGEALPLPGANRVYYSDADWKTGVMGMMSRAKLIIIRAGCSNSLYWELETAMKYSNVVPVCILFLHAAEADKRALIEYMKRLEISLGPLVQDQIERDNGFLCVRSFESSAFWSISAKKGSLGFEDSYVPAFTEFFRRLRNETVNYSVNARFKANISRLSSESSVRDELR